MALVIINNDEAVDGITILDDASILGSGTATDGQVLTADGSGGTAWETSTGTGSSTANTITFTSTTTIVANTVQSAIEELSVEKAALTNIISIFNGGF